MATFHIQVDVPDEVAGEVSLAIAEGLLLKEVARQTAEFIDFAPGDDFTAKLLYDPTEDRGSPVYDPELDRAAVRQS